MIHAYLVVIWSSSLPTDGLSTRVQYVTLINLTDFHRISLHKNSHNNVQQPQVYLCTIIQPQLCIYMVAYFWIIRQRSPANCSTTLLLPRKIKWLCQNDYVSLFFLPVMGWVNNKIRLQDRTLLVVWWTIRLSELKLGAKGHFQSVLVPFTLIPLRGGGRVVLIYWASSVWNVQSQWVERWTRCRSE